MYGDAGTAPVRSWNDLRAATEWARRAGSRLRAQRPAPTRAAGSAAGVEPTVVGHRIARLAVAAAAVTLVVGIAPFLHLAYRSPATHGFIDTAATVIAMLVTILLLARYRRSAELRDLLLVAAMGALSVANLLLSVVPVLVASAPAALSTWALLASRLLGAALLAGACAAPPARLRAPARTAAAVLGGCAACIALLAAGAIVLADQLPQAVETTLPPAAHPRLVGHPALLVAQLVGMALLAGAAAGFTRMARAQEDEFVAWLAAGAVLGAFARLNYFLFPSLFTDVVYAGDVFSLAMYAVLLTGALREIGAHHRGLAHAAVDLERRRIARDLHDGLAQDLAFIAARVRALESGSAGAVRFDQLTSAANRALDDSRAAIAALTRPVDEPLDLALGRNATEVAERLGGRADLHLQTGVEVPTATRESLVRIVRESVTNAMRHGRASHVAVSLAQDRELRLSIADDGCGFDAAARPAHPDSGFGLVSMGERAEVLGGALAIRSAPGSGTTIEVVLPCAKC
jgi:signal transduction histidine kinase